MMHFAVIDTETNWYDEVMSIGVVIAEADTFEIIDSRYYIIDPEYMRGGIYSAELMLTPKKMNVVKSRAKVIKDIDPWLKKHSVDGLYAYNATFDKRHLCELSNYNWFDIMQVAAYRQYNDKIPSNAECCKTGRLKCDYGVEPMMRLLSGNKKYFETHNALLDARDELEIMRLIGRHASRYGCAKIY